VQIHCVLVSHDKPAFVNQAVDSVLNQTHDDWRCLLLDSGRLLDAGHFANYHDPRLTVERAASIPKGNEPAPFLFNNFLKSVPEEALVCYLCDDDYYLPGAFTAFANFLSANPSAGACYGDQQAVIVRRDGSTVHRAWRLAREPAGTFGGGVAIDCHFDYCQFCHRASILKNLNEWWPTSSASAWHADGIFFERLGSVTPILPLPGIMVSVNRRTPVSRYGPC